MVYHQNVVVMVRVTVSDMVTMHLINTFCRPLLLYGCDSVPLCKSYIASLTRIPGTKYIGNYLKLAI